MQATFDDGIGNIVEIDRINKGYQVEINFPFLFAKNTGPVQNIYDSGADYDYITSTFDLEVPVTSAETLTTFFETYARNQSDVYFTVPESWGIYPFGPLYDLGTTFKCSINSFENKGQVSSPYLYHVFTIELTHQRTSASSVISGTGCGDHGNLTINGVSAIKFPQRLFEPDIQYSYSTNLTRNGTSYIRNRSSVNDNKNVSMDLWCGDVKASQLIYSLINTRAGDFTMIVKENSYPFGVEAGDNKTFNCRLNSDSIKMRHNDFNNWNVNLNLVKVS